MQYSSLVSRIYDPFIGPFLLGVRRGVVETLKELSPATVVDFCCGTGSQLRHLRKAGYEGLVGIDLSPNMVEYARSRRTFVDCRIEDATASSLESSSFDLAIVSFALHEKPKALASAMLSEMRRVVRKGGWVVVVDYLYDSLTRLPGRWSTGLAERIAGGEHFLNFKAYIAFGGLDTLFSGWERLSERRYLFGSVALRVYRV